MEEPLRGRHREQRSHFAAAAGLAEDRDGVGIAAELGDVLANPFESVQDVEHAHVARLRKLRTTEL